MTTNSNCVSTVGYATGSSYAANCACTITLVPTTSFPVQFSYPFGINDNRGYVDDYLIIGPAGSPQEVLLNISADQYAYVNISGIGRNILQKFPAGMPFLLNQSFTFNSGGSGGSTGFELCAVTQPPNYPTSVDWSSKGVTTGVNDQGNCGCCYAFSVAETIESFHFIKKGGSLQPLSKQQIISCDTQSNGCNGGNLRYVYGYVNSTGGLQNETSYPYKQAVNVTVDTCSSQSSQAVVKIAGYSSIFKSEYSLKHAVAFLGPVSVAINADNLQNYISGVMKSTCGGSSNHAVQIIGYNTTDPSNPYWVIRNQWSSSWGENGYARLLMGQNQCNIIEDTTFPLFS